MSRDNLIVPNMEDGADASTTSETTAKPTPPAVTNTTESEA